MLLGCCFFPHPWPLGLPQRESSSLELIQNCQMLPPEHSCISVHTIHTSSYFLTLFFGSSKQDLFRTYRTKSTCDISMERSSQVPRFPDFIWFPVDVRTVASPRAKWDDFFWGQRRAALLEANEANAQHRISKDRCLNNEWWWTDVNHG